MRNYAVVFPSFWSGTTGKAITIAGKDTRIMATYLLTCEHANMLGLYRMPLLYAAVESGLKRKEVVAALQKLATIGFAEYDEGGEFVWVIEMARFQLGLLRGESLKDSDHRATGATRLYKQLPCNPFLGPFYDRYAPILGLPFRRDIIVETKPLSSPFQGAPESLTRDDGPDPDAVPIRKGDEGETMNPATLRHLTAAMIRAQWNMIPGVKTCKALGETISKRIHVRIKEHPDLGWWDSFFQHVRVSDFLCGRTHGKEGPFRASLDWALTPNNQDKILAGNYDPVEPSPQQTSVACTKRIQREGDPFLRPCGNPATTQSKPNEPRCIDHLPIKDLQTKAVNHATH